MMEYAIIINQNESKYMNLNIIMNVNNQMNSNNLFITKKIMTEYNFYII